MCIAGPTVGKPAQNELATQLHKTGAEIIIAIKNDRPRTLQFLAASPTLRQRMCPLLNFHLLIDSSLFHHCHPRRFHSNVPSWHFDGKIYGESNYCHKKRIKTILHLQNPQYCLVAHHLWDSKCIPPPTTPVALSRSRNCTLQIMAAIFI